MNTHIFHMGYLNMTFQSVETYRKCIVTGKVPEHQTIWSAIHLVGFSFPIYISGTNPRYCLTHAMSHMPCLIPENESLKK